MTIRERQDRPWRAAMDALALLESLTDKQREAFGALRAHREEHGC